MANKDLEIGNKVNGGGRGVEFIFRSAENFRSL